MNFIKVSLLFIVIFLFPLFAIGQSVLNTHHQTSFFSMDRKPGLFLDMVYDESGFLWAGSYSLTKKGELGLMRFDGKDFHAIPLPDFGNNNFSTIDIQKTEKGDFYLLCWGEDYQLLKLDPYTLKFELVNFPGYGQPLFYISRTFAFDGKYYVIVQDKGKVSLFELKGASANKITDLSLPQNTEINKFTTFVPYEDYFVLVANGLGTALYNWEGEQVRLIREDGINRRFSLVYFNNNGYFLIDRMPVLYGFSPEKNKVIPFFDFREEIGFNSFWFWNDAKGRLLLSARKGNSLFLYEVTQNGLNTIGKLKDIPIIKWPVFYSKDAFQSLWLGNQADYLTHYKFPPQHIQHFLKDKHISALYQLDEKEFLVSTNNSGWYVVNIQNGTSKAFALKHNANPFSMIGTRNIIPAHNPRYVWTNSHNGIARVDLTTHQVAYWENQTVESLARLNDSLLVYGTFKNNLMVFNTQTKKHRVLLPEKTHWVRDLLVVDNMVYAATSGGLLVYDHAAKKHAYYAPDDIGVNRSFNCILYQSGENLILGSRSGKVYRFDLKTHSFSLLYEVPNKASVSTMFIYGKKLWINTRNGFFVLDTGSKEVQRYSTIDGFSGNYATRCSKLLTEKGIFIGTNQGLNYFEPSNLAKSKNKGEITALSIQMYNEETGSIEKLMNREKMLFGEKIVLPVNKRFIRLNFGMDKGEFFSKTNFKYRLNEEEWISTEEENSVRFVNLAPGQYQLEVAAFDIYGNKIGESLQYTIIAKDFFYNRWWFSAGIVLLLSLIIGGIVFYRKEKEENKLKQQSLENLNRSKQNLEKKLAAESLLFEERKQALTNRKRELVASTLQIAHLNNSIKAAIDESNKGATIHQLKQKLKLLLTQEGSWDLFIKKFVDVYPGFLEKLRTDYPQLTAKDMEFCALIKLNLSNKEIGVILNIDHHSVITKKYRLRKKIGLPADNISIEDWMAKY